MKKNLRFKGRNDYPNNYNFDYKDPYTLQKFIMESGKIIPARISKLTLAQQKKVAKQVKKARTLALLPVGSFAYDNCGRVEAVSATPFEF